jgi:hypothetical protein
MELKKAKSTLYLEAFNSAMKSTLRRSTSGLAEE